MAAIIPTPRLMAGVPSLSPSPTNATPSEFTRETRDSAGTRLRHRSPVKNVGDLRFANVEMRNLKLDETFRSLPKSAAQLITSLDDIDRGIGIIIQDRVADYINIRPENLTTEYHLTKDEAFKELQSLVDIIERAVTCTHQCLCEHAWNALVHLRLFETALAGSAGQTVKLWITSSASIVPKVAPGTINTNSSDQIASEMVDFCLTIEPKSQQKIDYILYHQSVELRTFNQSMYAPLRFRPIANSVVTKVDTSPKASFNWFRTRAWLNRMCMLLKLPNDTYPYSPQLPQIRIRGADWFVLVAYIESIDEQESRDSDSQSQDDEQDSDDGDIDKDSGMVLDCKGAELAWPNSLCQSMAHT
ncbi:hypothetical protein F4680DRAFT_454815 [Xylaria scruposa]|nr:hypothetical protein F4680DRAFT_454815 [Xylaria scruposa]